MKGRKKVGRREGPIGGSSTRSTNTRGLPFKAIDSEGKGSRPVVSLPVGMKSNIRETDRRPWRFAHYQDQDYRF